MLQTWHIIKGYVAGTVAVITCPCHLPLTLPLLVGLTSGTAVGAWLAQNTAAVFVAFTIFFVGGLVLAGKWLMKKQ